MKASNGEPPRMDWPTMTWSHARMLPLASNRSRRGAHAWGGSSRPMSSSRLHRVRTGAVMPAVRAAWPRRRLPPRSRWWGWHGGQSRHRPSGCDLRFAAAGPALAAAMASRPGIWVPIHSSAFVTICVQFHGAVQRLHGRVRQVREDELGADLCGALPAAPCRRGWRWPGFGGQFAVLGQQLGGVGLGHRAGVPFHLERTRALLGGPVAVGDDGNALAAPVGGHAQHGLHALDGLGGAVVQRLHLAPNTGGGPTRPSACRAGARRCQ